MGFVERRSLPILAGPLVPHEKPLKLAQLFVGFEAHFAFVLGRGVNGTGQQHIFGIRGE